MMETFMRRIKLRYKLLLSVLLQRSLCRSLSGSIWKFLTGEEYSLSFTPRMGGLLVVYQPGVVNHSWRGRE